MRCKISGRSVFARRGSGSSGVYRPFETFGTTSGDHNTGDRSSMFTGTMLPSSGRRKCRHATNAGESMSVVPGAAGDPKLTLANATAPAPRCRRRHRVDGEKANTMASAFRFWYGASESDCGSHACPPLCCLEISDRRYSHLDRNVAAEHAQLKSPYFCLEHLGGPSPCP